MVFAKLPKIQAKVRRCLSQINLFINGEFGSRNGLVILFVYFVKNPQHSIGSVGAVDRHKNGRVDAATNRFLFLQLVSPDEVWTIVVDRFDIKIVAIASVGWLGRFAYGTCAIKRILLGAVSALVKGLAVLIKSRDSISF